MLPDVSFLYRHPQPAKLSINHLAAHFSCTEIKHKTVFQKTQLAVDKDDDQPKRRKTLHLPFPFNPAIPGLSMISVFTLAKEV